MLPRRILIPCCAGLLLLGVTSALRAQGLEPEFSPEANALAEGYLLNALYVGLAAMFAVIAVLALLGIGSRGLRARAGEDKGPQLPAELRTVRVAGASYGLETFSGVVTSEKTIVKQDVSVTVTNAPVMGGTYHSGYWPWSTTTTVTSTVTHVIWLRYPDGGAGAWTLTGVDFHVAVGQVVSFVARPIKGGQHACVIAYNHAGGQFLRFSLFSAHRLAGLLSWLAATVVGVLVLYWIMPQLVDLMIADAGAAIAETEFAWLLERRPPMSMTIVPFTVIAAVIALVPFLVSLAVFAPLRERLFRSRYQGAIRDFLKASTATLKQKLGA